MAKPAPSPGEVVAQIRNLLGLRADQSATDLAAQSIEALRRHSRQVLLESAGRLGLVNRHKLTKETLVESLVRQFLDALGRVGLLSAPASREAREPAGDLARRFDLGRPAEQPAEIEHIPWGYGRDRVTAMVIDPNRLFVYWEVTDEAIAHARNGLGAAGASAWVDLRIYDVTGRIFDGTNAHSYVDQHVERTDRQWFFDVNRPGSAACVEVGLRSTEGYFVRIARSGRADFPRAEPAPPGDVEWLTVRTVVGDVGEPVVAPAGEPARAPAVPAVEGWAGEGAAEPDHGVAPGQAWERVERGEFTGEGGRIEWSGPAVHTAWEAGPFSAPIESPEYVEEHHSGTVTIVGGNGRMRIVYGPWQVVIRGIGGRTERRVVATWEMRCVWEREEGAVVEATGERVQVPAGSGWMLRGASERRWVGGSEWRLGGASELWFVGASERRLAGASEVLYVGASEWRAQGASERALRSTPRR